MVAGWVGEFHGVGFAVRENFAGDFGDEEVEAYHHPHVSAGLSPFDVVAMVLALLS